MACGRRGGLSMEKQSFVGKKKDCNFPFYRTSRFSIVVATIFLSVTEKEKSFERNKRKFNLQTSAHQRDHYRPPTSTRTAPDAILKHLCGAGMGDARCRGWWLENRNSCSISAPHPNDNFFNQFPRIKTNFLPRSEGVKCWAVMAG